MIVKNILFSISITFGSWIVGMILNVILSKTFYYKNLLNLNFLKSELLNKSIGLNAFKWIVRNTFFKYFNQKLTIKNKATLNDLNELRTEMVFAEISHLIAFLVVTAFAIVKFVQGNYWFGIIFMIINILMNLYPSLLQQQNKRRIDQFIKRLS